MRVDKTSIWRLKRTDRLDYRHKPVEERQAFNKIGYFRGKRHWMAACVHPHYVPAGTVHSRTCQSLQTNGELLLSWSCATRDAASLSKIWLRLNLQGNLTSTSISDGVLLFSAASNLALAGTSPGPPNASGPTARKKPPVPGDIHVNIEAVQPGISRKILHKSSQNTLKKQICGKCWWKQS